MGWWPFARRQPQQAQTAGPQHPPAPLGALGETLADRFCRRAGMKILARNYRCPAGEVDLIALDRSTRKSLRAETIVFVEVKTRTCDLYASPAAAVDSRKQDQVRSAARYYLAHYPTEGYLVRYDVISIVARGGEEPEITHMPGAF